VRPGDTGSRSGQRLFIGDGYGKLNGHQWHLSQLAPDARTHDTVVTETLW